VLVSNNTDRLLCASVCIIIIIIIQTLAQSSLSAITNESEALAVDKLAELVLR